MEVSSKYTRRTVMCRPHSDITAPRMAEERIHKMLKKYANPLSLVKHFNTPKIIRATFIISNASYDTKKDSAYKSSPELDSKYLPAKRIVRRNILLDKIAAKTSQ